MSLFIFSHANKVLSSYANHFNAHKCLKKSFCISIWNKTLQIILAVQLPSSPIGAIACYPGKRQYGAGMSASLLKPGGWIALLQPNPEHTIKHTNTHFRDKQNSLLFSEHTAQIYFYYPMCSSALNFYCFKAKLQLLAPKLLFALWGKLQLAVIDIYQLEAFLLWPQHGGEKVNYP